jgi:hypothetical protein
MLAVLLEIAEDTYIGHIEPSAISASPCVLPPLRLQMRPVVLEWTIPGCITTQFRDLLNASY